MLEAEFSMPFLSHAAWSRILYCPRLTATKSSCGFPPIPPAWNRGPRGARARASTRSTIVVNNEYQGGDFGRRSGMEHTTEAVLLAKAAGRPVKVV